MGPPKMITSYHQNQSSINYLTRGVDLADVIKLRTLRWGNDPGLLGVITRIPRRRRQRIPSFEGKESEKTTQE